MFSKKIPVVNQNLDVVLHCRYFNAWCFPMYSYQLVLTRVSTFKDNRRTAMWRTGLPITITAAALTESNSKFRVVLLSEFFVPAMRALRGTPSEIADHKRCMIRRCLLCVIFACRTSARRLYQNCPRVLM